MGIFRWLERKLFTGVVVKDYGLVMAKSLGAGRRSITLLLCRAHGKLQVVFRQSAWALFGGSVSYVMFEATHENLTKLAELVADTNELLRVGGSSG